MASSHNFVRPYDGNGLQNSLLTNHSFQATTDLPEAVDHGLFSSVDRMAGKRDARATAGAVVVNGLIAVSILWMGAHRMVAVVSAPVKVVTLIAPLAPAPLPKLPPKAVVMSGGGGQPMPQPVARGNPPRLAMKPVLIAVLNPPKLPPRLAVEPTFNVQPDLKMAKADVPTIGMANAAPAVQASMGNGSGAGLGAGIGSGFGAGSGGKYGGGIFKIGGGVTKPEVISAPDPGFTEEARLAKVAGKVVVYLQVNPEGHPVHVKVLRGLGMGLDEKALEAVREYRFKPAMKDGHPVTVEMNVEVNFQIL